MRYIKVLMLLMAAVILLAGCAAPAQESGSAALVPRRMPANKVSPNPFMADTDNSVHNDSYSSDVTDAVLPLGIDPVLGTSLETLNPMAPPSAFFDSRQNMITPLLGGVAIVDANGGTIERAGRFIPAQDDSGSGGYVVQISYSFVDAKDNVVMPTSHGHVIAVRTMDENGNILPVFEKVLDVDVVGLAKEQLGEDIDPNLLSIVYDYSGNLWFVTGGFRIYPDRNPAGFLGYISREYIETAMNGQPTSPDGNIFFHRLSEGEGAENGISSNGEGAVILTNMSCYMLKADKGVQISWKTDYDSNGANDAQAGSAFTGGGLSWGSGTTPTLTDELVLFTDNMDPVNLLALSARTGEVVAKTPVLDRLGRDVPVSVDNSILVYDAGEGRTSVLVCNWFGAGNAALAEPDADSSIQSYDNIYDANWISQGGRFIAPGVERVDIIRSGGAYKAEKVWLRDDIRDTSMIKLSTATGYLYGYWQNLETGMWCYEVLDFDTGETALELPVSSSPLYNNMAVGMISHIRGNGLYCPTNSMEMVRWQDDLVYLPDSPARAVPFDAMERYDISDEEFAQMSGTGLKPASYFMKLSLPNILEDTTVAFKVNGLSGKAADYSLLYETARGRLAEYGGPWQLWENGKALDANASLEEDVVYELRMPLSDQAETDLDDGESAVRLAVILGK